MLIRSIIISISPTGVNKEAAMGRKEGLAYWLQERKYKELFGSPSNNHPRRKFTGSAWYYRLSERQMKTCQARGIRLERA